VFRCKRGQLEVAIASQVPPIDVHPAILPSSTPPWSPESTEAEDAEWLLHALSATSK
jgi:hypothetical protein